MKLKKVNKKKIKIELSLTAESLTNFAQDFFPQNDNNI